MTPHEGVTYPQDRLRRYSPDSTPQPGPRDVGAMTRWDSPICREPIWLRSGEV